MFNAYWPILHWIYWKETLKERIFLLLLIKGEKQQASWPDGLSLIFTKIHCFVMRVKNKVSLFIHSKPRSKGKNSYHRHITPIDSITAGAHRWKQQKHVPSLLVYKLQQLKCIQFSSVRSLDWLGHRGTWGMIQQRPSSSLFCRRALWAVLAWAEMSTLYISSAHHSITNPQRCPEGWFWRGCRGVWHASFCLLTVARRGSCGPVRKLILLHTQSLVSCSK